MSADDAGAEGNPEVNRAGSLDRQQAELLAILVTEAVGRPNAIPSTALADRLGIEEANGNPATRFDIREIMRATGVPIGSCSDGYFIITTDAELAAYVANLRSRIAGIEERIALVTANFDRFGPETGARDALGAAPSQQTLDGFDGGGDGTAGDAIDAVDGGETG